MMNFKDFGLNAALQTVSRTDSAECNVEKLMFFLWQIYVTQSILYQDQ